MMDCSDLLAHLDLPELKVEKFVITGKTFLELFVECETTLMNGIRMARENAEPLYHSFVRNKEQRKPNNSAETGAEAEYLASFKGSRSVLLKIRFRLDRNRIYWSEFGCNRSFTEV